MKEFNAYLNFDGNCRQAMEFYEKCLGAELQIMPFSQGPMEVPKGAEDKVLHARLAKGTQAIMASDCLPGMPLQQGNNFSISINCDSRAEVDKLLSSLGEKGKLGMDAQGTFWGTYFAMATDQFGINWMFNYEVPK